MEAPCFRRPMLYPLSYGRVGPIRNIGPAPSPLGALDTPADNTVGEDDATTVDLSGLFQLQGDALTGPAEQRDAVAEDDGVHVDADFVDHTRLQQGSAQNAAAHDAECPSLVAA